MTTYIGSRDRAKQFRSMLKKSFPGVKFSVRCDTGTAYNWIAVKWYDGPTAREVNELLRPLHEDLSVARKYSPEVKRSAAEILEAHYPELDVFTEDGSINWNLETCNREINIGRALVRHLTMNSTVSDIAEHYVLGDEEQFSNAAEREQKRLDFLANQDAELKQAELEASDSDDENLLQHKAGEDAQHRTEEDRGRLTRGNPFVLGMHPGEKAHLDVRTVTPFEAVLTAVPDQQAAEEPRDLTPREVTSLSPMGRPLVIFSVPALVMADTDGYQAGETVWVGKTISTVLDDVERVLVSRGDGHPLQPVTTNFLTLV